MSHRIRSIIFFFLSFAFLLISEGAGLIAQTITKPRHRIYAKHIQRKIHRIKKLHRKDSLWQGSPKLQKTYPTPGSSGEDRNFDWYRNRAFPNESIDPSAYTNAL